MRYPDFLKMTKTYHIILKTVLNGRGTKIEYFEVLLIRKKKIFGFFMLKGCHFFYFDFKNRWKYDFEPFWSEKRGVFWGFLFRLLLDAREHEYESCAILWLIVWYSSFVDRMCKLFRKKILRKEDIYIFPPFLWLVT